MESQSRIASGAVAPIPLDDRQAERLEEIQEEEDLVVALLPVIKSWKIILLVALLAAIGTYLVCKFVWPRTYRTMAILRPAESQTVQSKLQGVGALGGMMGVAPSLFGGGSNANEYVAILKSHTFTQDTVQRHSLPRTVKDTMERFDASYSPLTGNITLYYKDSTPEEAARVLEFFVDDLREDLRRHDVTEASAVISSLTEEVKNVPDPLLVTKIDELLAKQIEDEKLAQAESDFAFRVIEPPFPPDRVYRPMATVTAALVAFGVVVIWSAFLVFRPRWKAFRARVELAEANEADTESRRSMREKIENRPGSALHRRPAE